MPASSANPEAPSNPADFVKSLERGLAVMRCFDADHPRLTLAETAKYAEISRASARRYLYTLEQLGYMKTDGKHYWLAPKVLALGYSYLSTQPLKEVAEPHLRELSRKVGESVSVSILDDDSVVYIARVAAERIMTIAISVGTRLPATITSMGRVLLSGFDDDELKEFFYRYSYDERIVSLIQKVRETGYALVDQELDAGLRSLAVPIRDVQGNIMAAMNVSTRVGTHNAEFSTLLEQILPQLQETALAIADDFRHRQ